MGGAFGRSSSACSAPEISRQISGRRAKHGSLTGNEIKRGLDMGKRASSFLQGLSVGAALGRQFAGAWQEGQLRDDLANASQTHQVTEQVSGDDARANIEANFVPQEGGPQTAAEFIQQTPGVADTVANQKAAHLVAGKAYDSPSAAATAARGLNMRAMSDTYARHGHPDAAARLDERADRMMDAEQRRSESEELKRALSGSRTAASEPLRASIATGSAITGASHVPEIQSPGSAAPSATAGPAAKPDPKFEYSFDSYLKNVAPGALQTLVKQGRLDEAKKFADFVESEEGKAYAVAWINGVRRNAVGDSLGALRAFERLYNSQGFNDGLTVKMTPLDGGKRYRIDQIDADGNVLGGQEGTTDDLAHAAANALSPMSAVKFYAERERASQKETAMQAREDAREDRRDARLAARLSSQQERGTGSGRLSLAQERSNAEIDAAREAVAGLSPEEIRKRTAKTTDTGRENPHYDPAIARSANLASRRKVGDDPLFDQRSQGQQPASPAYDRADVTKRFRGDRSMDGYTLGRDTPDGVEVLQKGKVVGHYR